MDIEGFITKEHPIWNIIGSYLSRVCSITSFVRLIEYIEKMESKDKTADEITEYRRENIQRHFIDELSYQEKYGYYHYLIINNLQTMYKSQIISYLEASGEGIRYCHSYIFMG